MRYCVLEVTNSTYHSCAAKQGSALKMEQHFQNDSVYLYNNRWLRNTLREQEHMDMQLELLSTVYDRDLYQVAAEVERRVNIQRGTYNYEDELSDFEEDDSTLSILEMNDSDLDSEIIDIIGNDEDDGYSRTTESMDFDMNDNIQREDQSDEVESDTVNEPANDIVNDVMSYNRRLYQFALILESVKF